MIKDVVSKLDYSNFDELALVLFAGAFLIIVWGAFRLSKDATDRFSAIPLSDVVQDPFTPPMNAPDSVKKEMPNHE
jgi:cytochrome c oxidase cbb3-type subunit IV